MKFPKTLRAVRSSDGSQWKIGDALLEECGPPTEGRPGNSHLSASLADVAGSLAGAGFDYSSSWLGQIRLTAHRFPPERRTFDVPFRIYSEIAAGTPDLTPAQREKRMGQVIDSIDGPPTLTAVAKALGRRSAARDGVRIEALSPAEFAEAVASNPAFVDAIVRNDKARELVEDAAIGHRATNDTRTPAEIKAEIDREGRRTRNAMAKTLGDEEDLATSELHGAARQIMQAVVLAEEFGITDPDAEAEAIARIKRNLRIYEEKADVNDADREWAAAKGIDL